MGGIIECLSSNLNLYLYSSSKEIGNDELDWITENFNATIISYNAQLESRKCGNDPLSDLQWYIEFINLPEVWDYTTGGKTYSGKEIVIAILDEATQINHPDLTGNIYFNSSEIPNNNIDDDLNGYIDDVNGINVVTNNGKHVNGDHGTWVSGIAGAKGNNSLGVTGVNWNIKILPITNVKTVAGIIKGYDYILKLRKKYNDSNGGEGAYIVVNNYSGGLPGKFGTDPVYKPWCDMYDLLGQQGVLSVAAVENNGIDVEEDGDLPSTCPSEFLIAVTNIDNLGERAMNSAYGKKSVDLAAPGENIFGLKSNGYYSTGGTSASAPMVAGVAALMYSIPCETFEKKIMSEYIEGSRIIRDAIFNGAVLNPNLTNKTVTGAHLNALGTFKILEKLCDNPIIKPSKKGTLEITNIQLQADKLVIDYVTPDELNAEIIIFDVLGRILKSKKFVPKSFGIKQEWIDLKSFLSGVYYVTLLQSGNRISKGFQILR
jgi:hypothetical protein